MTYRKHTLSRQPFAFYSASRPVILKLARSAQQHTLNLAHYFNPTVIAVVLTACLASWMSYRWLAQPSWLRSLPQRGIEAFDLFEFGTTIALVILWVLLGWWYWRNRPKAASVNSMYALSPVEFEEYVARLFRKKGYRVKRRGGAGDQGVDLEIVRRNGRRRAIVQCKRYRNTVGPDTVRELYGTFRHEKVSHAFLVTTASISKGARDWAEGKPITLIDGDTLAVIANDFDVKV